MLAHRRKHMDGTMTGRECFVDMRNGTVVEPESGWDTKELPYATGETSSQQHQTDVFRENFDRIDWNGGKVKAAPDVNRKSKPATSSWTTTTASSGANKCLQKAKNRDA